MKQNKRIFNVRFSNWKLVKWVLLLAIVSVFTFSCGKEEQQTPVKKVTRPVKMMTLKSADTASTFSFPGKVRAAQKVELAFQVAGPLIKLLVKEGQEVKKGDHLAQIDPKDFQTSLQQTKGQLAKATAAIERAQSEYKRILRIMKEDPGATSQSMVDRKREAVDAAKAEISSFKAAVQGAKDQLGYTRLMAPFTGVIAKRYVDNFEEIKAKQPILSLQNISQIEILIDLPENFMARVKDGTAKAYAEFTAAPGERFELKVKEVAQEADSQTQTYQVVLEMISSPAGVRILPGMTANVVGRTQLEGSAGEKYVIPAIAVFADDAGNPHVWVVSKDTMTVQKRKVTTGDLTGTDSIQILDGLQPGEQIAITGVAQLREGMSVRNLSELEGYER
jgi:RND family efflux transporter MFP subunit